MNWINLHENRKRELSKLYWVKKLPTYFLIDKNGNIDFSKADPFVFNLGEYWSLQKKLGTYGFSKDQNFQ